MVIILIRLFKCFKKLEEGILLDEGELRIIRSYLGLRFSFYQVRGIFFPLGFIILGIVILVLSAKLYILTIIALILAVLTFVYFIPLYPKIFRNIYERKLELFLEYHLKVNYGDLKYISYQPHTAFEITKNTAYFYYDDYYFKIIEDLLKYERYSIGKKEILFKYPDYNSINKKPLTFKLADIVSFSTKENIPLEESTLLDLVRTIPTEKPTLRINLTNFKSIYISSSLAFHFRKIIWQKEVNNY